MAIPEQRNGGTGSGPESEAAPGEPTSRRKALILGTLCITLFMAMLDNVVVNTALPKIGSQLHAGVTGLQWVVEGYSLVYAALLLTGGTLGDRFGRKRVFLAGVVGFTLGSMLCALSGSIGELVTARMVQGVGAAMLTPGSLSIIRNTFPDSRERARAIGLWSGISGLGLALGPAVGGPLVDAFGWSSVFWINVPIGAVALLVGWRVLPEFHDGRDRFDIPGQITGALGFGALVFALIEGPSSGWGSVKVLTAAAIALLALVSFVVIEATRATPMLDLSFFRDRVISGALLSGFMVSFGMFGALFFLPLLMQDVYGWSPTMAGIGSLPATASIMVAAPVAGIVTGRLGPRPALVTGLLLCAASLGGLSLYGLGAHYGSYVWTLPVMGLGMGLSFAPVSVAVLERVPAPKAGIASAVTNTMREVGGVVGIAALGAILTSRMTGLLGHKLHALGVDAGHSHQVVGAVTNGGAGGITASRALPPPLRDTVDSSFVQALHLALRSGAGLLALAAIAAWLLLRAKADRQVLAQPSEVAAPSGSAV
ncbi:MFS transporter [Catenulispora sp. NF23]|uniref:MFS transporter n=1 Tax=Catenulispora pinistramenti TaxID=2705254 RepID=A0ABS5L2X7_9ACTN|nr:MFS transporter [Catenulispora pinistramenti]MBS2535702.1 MFS transporter [Catenulispora pinistramenti]MBS2552495.1 MFS transporter [Catenulispora pinistramenti]